MSYSPFFFVNRLLRSWGTHTVSLWRCENTCVSSPTTEEERNQLQLRSRSCCILLPPFNLNFTSPVYRTSSPPLLLVPTSLGSSAGSAAFDVETSNGGTTRSTIDTHPFPCPRVAALNTSVSLPVRYLPFLLKKIGLSVSYWHSNQSRLPVCQFLNALASRAEPHSAFPSADGMLLLSC